MSRRRLLAAALEPALEYAADERDVVVVRIEVAGNRAGGDCRVVHQIVDRRDLTTGLSAMSRTVGFTAAIGARLIGSGRIRQRGLLSPVHDVPYEEVVGELGRHGIRVNASVRRPPPSRHA